MRILETAVQRGIKFRVIIVDSRPQQNGEIDLIKKIIYSSKYRLFRFEICSKIISIEC